jgi:hypothetical protein
MGDIGHKLKIRFGLVSEPSEGLVAEWVRRTESNMAAGLQAETAGERAAREVFPDCGHMAYRAEADTILALLNEAKGRPGPGGR